LVSTCYRDEAYLSISEISWPKLVTQ